MTEYPAAEVIRVEPNDQHPGAYLVTVKCPYNCKSAQHTHGLPSTEHLGHFEYRVPHCAEVHDYRPDYFFIVTPEMIP